MRLKTDAINITITINTNITDIIFLQVWLLQQNYNLNWAIQASLIGVISYKSEFLHKCSELLQELFLYQKAIFQ